MFTLFTSPLEFFTRFIHFPVKQRSDWPKPKLARSFSDNQLNSVVECQESPRVVIVYEPIKEEKEKEKEKEKDKENEGSFTHSKRRKSLDFAYHSLITRRKDKSTS